MKITVGHKVKFLNQDLEGSIKEVLLNNRLIVTCIDGFDYEVAVGEILIVGEDNTHMYTVDEKELEKKIRSSSKMVNTQSDKSVLQDHFVKGRFSGERTVEVDLHLEELVAFPQKLDDWQKLHTQMQHVKKCLNAAFNKKIHRIIFIHGVGTGVLKTELINYLYNCEGVIVNPADFREYGRGATEVVLKQ